MSEFLMVIPEGWAEIEGDIDALIDSYGGEIAVMSALAESPNNIDTVIEPLGLPPAGSTVMGCRIFKDGGATRMWVQYGPTGN